VKASKVVVSIDVCIRIKFYVTKDLHPNNGEDEKQHKNEQANIRQCLKWRKNIHMGIQLCQTILLKL